MTWIRHSGLVYLQHRVCSLQNGAAVERRLESITVNAMRDRGHHFFDALCRLIAGGNDRIHCSQ